MSGVDDLKALLQSSAATIDLHSSLPPPSSLGTGGRPFTGGLPRQEKKNDIPVLDELASLIGSVDFDLNPSKQSNSIPVVARSLLPFSLTLFQAPSKRNSSTSGTPFSKAADSIMNMRDLFANVKQFQEEESKETVEDKEDYSVIRYGVSCTLRGPQVRRERASRTDSLCAH
jgi:hypothetical protein